MDSLTWWNKFVTWSIIKLYTGEKSGANLRLVGDQHSLTVGVGWGLLTGSPVLHHNYCTEKHEDLQLSLWIKNTTVTFCVSGWVSKSSSPTSWKQRPHHAHPPSQSRRSCRLRVESPGARTHRELFGQQRRRWSWRRRRYNTASAAICRSGVGGRGKWRLLWSDPCRQRRQSGARGEMTAGGTLWTCFLFWTAHAPTNNTLSFFALCLGSLFELKYSSTAYALGLWIS